MITITTGNLTEFAWIVMGVWAAVTVFREVLDDVMNHIENNKYLQKRFDDLNEAYKTLYKQHQELKEKNDD
jgi:sugar (pentulose or hexulose) kinase